MASDSNPGTQVSHSNPGSITSTPIKTNSRTLYRFGDRPRGIEEQYQTLAEEMSPYFVGPMPASAFLSKFLPLSKLSLPEVVPSYKQGMFKEVVSKRATKAESAMYEPFIAALTPHMSNYQICVTANLGDQADTDFPFKIRPDCSVYAKTDSCCRTNSSTVELFIEFKRRSSDDPFIIKVPSSQTSSTSSSDNATPSLSLNPIMKTSSTACTTCGQITAYATSQMGAQYRTHIFSILIILDYARLIRWDRSGAIVTEPIYYNEASELFDFLIYFDHSPPDVRGHDTTVRLANPEEIKGAIKEVKELEGQRTSLLVVSVPAPKPATEVPLEYVVASPLPSLWTPVGRWTRTSIGYDITRKKKIFLKDSWRLLLEGVPKEGDVYSRFEANSVPNVPRCSNSGDIGDDEYHSTQTNLLVNANWAFSCTPDVTPHRHYRLILDDIGQPLESFERSSDMVQAIYAALIAHQSAYKCGILHRDLSPGNILITSDAKFSGGLLIDWDLCKDVTTQSERPHRTTRTGTWQFMAADLVEDPTINHTFVHDLESAFYVLFWLSIRFLPGPWNSEARSTVMNQLFNPMAFSGAGTSSKASWMAGPSAMFKVLDNTPLTGLIWSLRCVFQARHLKIESVDEHSDVPIFLPPGSGSGPVLKRDEPKIQEYLNQLVDHTGIISIFRMSLGLVMLWPWYEPATKQDISIPKAVRLTASKRSNTNYGKGPSSSSQKRLRTK